MSSFERPQSTRSRVTQKWISTVEQGKSRAWIGQVLRLASFLEISLVGSLSSDPYSASETSNKHVNHARDIRRAVARCPH